MRVDELDYNLPPGRIATEPADPRDAARLMVVDRASGRIEHRRVHELVDMTGGPRRGDLMVFNQTRVLPAHFAGTRAATGGKVTGLYLATTDGLWRIMLESRGSPRPGETIALDSEASLELVERYGGGEWSARLSSDHGTLATLERIGMTPLPPYIRHERRAQGLPEVTTEDRRRYNTVFARDAGSVAAPTAGLHFTPPLLAALDAVGVRRASVTLHVGLGTFAPVRADNLEDHDIHREWIDISRQTIAVLRETREIGGRVFVVGTTTVRALESLPADWASLDGYSTRTGLFITPGFSFRFTDALLTNFHLPRSTLLALVASLPGVGLDRLKHWYHAAIEEGYRFYSYGDAMLIL
jgi:S-adenosylmethionine:tRNA ribosyltransferase-isomerase